MQSVPHLLRRGTAFYYRARVPHDLIEHLGRREVWISLRTADQQTAKLRLAETHIHQLMRFDAIRRGFELPAATLTFITPEKAPKKSRGATIDDLMDYWVSQAEKRPRTLLDARTALGRLKSVVTQTAADLITKQEAIAFKDRLIAQGLAHATILKNIGLVKSMFELALRNDLIKANPFADLKLPKPARCEKPRLSFSLDDLQKIFGSAVFTRGQRPIGGAGEAAYWLPLIALLTGMRLEEIGQLRKTDIKSREGIWYIDLDYQLTEGRTLKSDSSRRQIPLHQSLIDLGFLDLAKKSEEVLFPLLKSAGHRQLTASWSQWFGRYLRQEIGLTDKRKTFHSFRHTFKDLCREVGVPKHIHDRLTGHKSTDVGDGYGGAVYPLKPLALAIEQIEIPIQLSFPTTNALIFASG
jgi:integrase